MGTVPMLCPYKMMFSGLIPYLGAERAGQRSAPASHRQEIQPRGSPCFGHSTLRGSLGWGGGNGALSPLPLPSSSWLGPTQLLAGAENSQG